MILTLIAACAHRRVMGAETGQLPWDLPRDRAHFRRYCEGKTLLIGRRTYGEMDGWFRPGHRPLVLTKRADFDPHHEGTENFSNLDAALAHAREAGIPELVCCGGATIYRAALPHADRIVLTEIDADYPGDLHFPELPEDTWTEKSRQSFPPDPENPHPMDIVHLRRIAGQTIS